MTTDEMPFGVQLRRTPGWSKPPNTVSVARPTRWGNPVRVGDPCEIRVMSQGDGGRVGVYRRNDARAWDSTIGNIITPEIAVAVYRADLEATLRLYVPGEDPDEDEIVEALRGLRGKNLGCFCPLGQPCHRDVLLEVANRKDIP